MKFFYNLEKIKKLQRGGGESVDQVVDKEGIEQDVIGKNERRKITIPEQMSPEEIQEKYGVSRATAYRGKERGWIFINYLERVIEQDDGWAQRNADALRKNANSAARIMLGKASKHMRMNPREFIAQILTPYSFEDLESIAITRIIELAGHQERDSELWRIKVGTNSVSDFLKTHMNDRLKTTNVEARIMNEYSD